MEIKAAAQAWIDAAYEKVVQKRTELEKIIDEHNATHNPSGVPYKGDQKRPAEVDSLQEEEAAVSLPALQETWEALKPDVELAGPSSNVKVGIKDGSLYLLGVEDGVVTAKDALACFWGRYLCDSTDKKDIAKNKDKLPWKMTDTNYVASFTIATEKNPKADLVSFPASPQSLAAFLHHLEKNSVANQTVEMQELTYSQSPNPLDPGKMTSSYTVKPIEDCYFLPQSVPKNVTVSQENAASSVNLSYNWETGIHQSGHVRILLSLEYSEERNTILPRRPKLHLVKPVKLFKGQVVKLA